MLHFFYVPGTVLGTGARESMTAPLPRGCIIYESESYLCVYEQFYLRNPFAHITHLKIFKTGRDSKYLLL